MKPKLIIIGGFLGAGKTTLLKAVSRIYQKQSKKVGLITNDQAEGLVDTHVLAADGNKVQEIAGSCFCCNFNGLMDAALYLKDAGSEVIIAEPVGSCTDLSATLMQPISSYHKSQFDLAPLSVLIDPIKVQEVLQDEDNAECGSAYIYYKQLEEADYLIVNKMDLLDQGEREKLSEILTERFENSQLKCIAAATGEGLDNWLHAMNTDDMVGRNIADIDYDIYAEGEARMGWYNGEFFIRHKRQLLIPWAEFNLLVLQLLKEVFQYEGIEIGHVKTFLTDSISEINANLTGTNREVEISGSPFSSAKARFLVNIRAEVSPEILCEIMEDVTGVYQEEGYLFDVVLQNFVKPGRPVPTYRMIS